MTREEIQAIADAAAHKSAEEAAERAVTKTLLALGIPAHDPLKAQAIFLHLENQYDACQTIKQHSLKTAVGIVTTAFIAYLLLFFGWRQL